MSRSNKVSRQKRKASGDQKSKPRKRPNPSKRKSTEGLNISASAKKIKLNTAKNVPINSIKHYAIIDFLLVFSAISSLVLCKQCGENITFNSCGKIGLGFEIEVKCAKCKPRYIPSSEKKQSQIRSQ